MDFGCEHSFYLLRIVGAWVMVSILWKELLQGILL